jgi:plastocyanin
MRRVAACLVALGLLVLSSGPAAATRYVPAPSLAPAVAPRTNFTLYGHSIDGWGFSNATTSKPGPTLTVYLGDSVEMTLIAKDLGTRHNWFIDYDNSTQQGAGEPASPNFNGPGDPKVGLFEFVADRPGNWTYRCDFHPRDMWGILRVMPTGRPLNATLVGSSSRGWGVSNTTISNPGPGIQVGSGAHITLTLLANASDANTRHNWFIDYDGNRQRDTGEPASPDFNGPSDPKVLRFAFNATRAGSFIYRCEFHPTVMLGSIDIVGQASAPPMGLGVGLIPGIMLIALGGVLVFAVAYQVRAVRAAKRPK